ncbi:hypothetical protein [Acidaminobacter hydrogenoformans]|uniref:hypothetical protein n=1 Tax=Acidaminobacter hydrogenoformans TaxID=65403 RepID=UPI001113EA37|nr:hypothetical protein [Acidaminobacter hydrogenoformans]
MAKVKTIKEELSTESKVSAEKRRLKSLFKDVSSEKLKLVDSLLDNAAWMIVKLQELRDIVDREGLIDEYQNGANQWGKKRSAAADLYNSILKNFMTLMRQLTDLVPESKLADDEIEDEFMQFVNNRG